MAKKNWISVQLLAALMTLGMFGVTPVSAADNIVATAVGQQLLADGDTLTVKNGGFVNVTATDVDVVAVRGDVQTGTYSHDGSPVFAVTNGSITVESGGTISAGATATDGNNTDLYARAIEADDGVTISNAGTLSATVTSEDVGYTAHAFTVQVHTDDLESGPVVIENLVDGTIEATAGNSAGGAVARGIQTGDEIAELDIDNKGLISADATATSDTANAVGIKVGRDSSGTIINSKTIEATATSLDENTAESTGIQVGQQVTDGILIDITNELGGMISAKAYSMPIDPDTDGPLVGDGYKAVARGIHAGDGIIGTIINRGTIEALAEGGYDAKAFAVQGEGGMTLDNFGAITAGLTVNSDDDISGSRAVGVFAADAGSIGSDVTIFNDTGASISATANYDIAGYLQQNPGAIGIRVSDGYLYEYTDGTDMGVERTITNAGTISAISTLTADDVIRYNPGSMGIRTGQTYVNNYGADRTLTSELAISNSGTIIADTTINSGSYIDDNAGAFGVRTGQTEARNYDSGTAAAAAITTIVNTGKLEITADLSTVGYIPDSSGAFGIRTGQTEAYDGNLDTTSTASATTTITNSGAITVDATVVADDYLNESSGSYGIRAGSTSTSGYEATASTTITNSAAGSIFSTATLTSPEMSNSNGAYGIRVGNDYDYAGDGNYNVMVDNAGSISTEITLNTDYVNGGTNYNRGAFGIRTGTAKIVNSGDITAIATMNGLNDSAYDGAYGIRTGHGAATVVHSGTITATLTDNDDSTLQRAVGIMTGRGDNQIHLSGSIAATATGGEAYSVVMGCEDDIAADNSNILYVMNGASLTSDVLNAGDGIADVVFGVAKDSATGMAQDGVADSAAFFAFSGDFLGNDNDADPLTANVGWNATLLGGTLAGDIDIDGTFTQEAASTYLAKLGSLAPTLLNVSDTATLADGALLGVEASGYVDDGTYTVVSADTLVGFYAAEPIDSMVLDYTLVNDSDNTVKVGVVRTPYTALPITPNQATLGNALAAGAIAGFLPAAEYLSIVDNSQTAASLSEALGAISPEQYPNLLDISLAGSTLYRSTVASRLGSLHLTKSGVDKQMANNTLTANGPALSRVPAFERTKGDWSGWVRAIGGSGDQDSAHGVDGYDFDTHGFSIGFDNQISDNLTLGFGFGFSGSDIDFGAGKSADVDSYHASLYGTFSTQRFYLDGAILYANSEYESVRYNTILSETVTGESDGKEMGIYIGGGYNLIDNDDWFFIPTASLELANTDIDGFTEKGSILNLKVNGYNADSLVSTLGFRLGANTSIGETKIVPEFRLAWGHEFGDTDRTVKASLAGTTSTFSIDGIEPDEDSALVGLGLNAYMSNDSIIFIDYDGEFRSDFAGHAISGGVRFNF